MLLPSAPYEARSLRFETALGLTFQNFSCETRQAAEAEGKKPHWELFGNFDEPS